MGFLKRLFGEKEDQGEDNKLPLTIESLFKVNFEEIPDESFSFTRDININDEVLVVASKNLSYKEASIFDVIKTRIFKSGEMNISFESPNYHSSQFLALKMFLNKVYNVIGADTNGDVLLTLENQKYLQSPGNLTTIPIWITWNSNGHYSFSGELNRDLSFTFSKKASEKIKELYYFPNAVLTSNGLIPEREQLLNKTEASMEYDEFEKTRRYTLTEIANVRDDLYLYTFSFDESVVKNLDELTKIGISFSYSENTFFIHLISFDKNFQLDKGDNIIFLFVDQSTIEIEVIIDKVKTPYDAFRTVSVLTPEQMRDFAMKKLKKWKMTSKRKAIYQVGGFAKNVYIQQYRGENEGQYILQMMARSLIKSILLHEGNTLGFNIDIN